MKTKILLTSLAGVLALATTARAEQGGSAHYMPGAAASFIDAFPGKPGGLAVLNYFTYYDAGVDANRQLPLGGFLAANVDATVYADTLAAIYQTPWNVLGGGYAFGVAVPYVWMEVNAQAQRIQPGGTLGPVVAARDTANGIGDLTLIPFMLGWTNLAPDLKVDARLSIYAPTGDYEAGLPTWAKTTGPSSRASWRAGSAARSARKSASTPGWISTWKMRTWTTPAARHCTST